MEIFEELESQLSVRNVQTQTVLVEIGNQHLQLHNPQQGSDFITGSTNVGQVFLSLSKLQRLQGEPAHLFDNSLEEVLAALNYPLRVRLLDSNQAGWIIRVVNKLLEMEVSGVRFLKPICAIAGLVLLPVDN